MYFLTFRFLGSYGCLLSVHFFAVGHDFYLVSNSAARMSKDYRPIDLSIRQVFRLTLLCFEPASSDFGQFGVGVKIFFAFGRSLVDDARPISTAKVTSIY